MILDFPDQIARLADVAASESIESVLSETACGSFLRELDKLVLAAFRSRTSLLGWLMPPSVAARFPASGNPWLRVRAYCKRHFGDDLELLVPPHLVEALVALFKPDGSGIWIGRDVLAQREPDLQFDKEGLLVGSAEFHYTTQGVLTGDHWLFYLGVPGVGMSGGFAEALLAMAVALGGPARALRVAINRDVVLARDYHHVPWTRAYIRGPRGISETQLQDPAFPPDPTGTITEHLYEDPDCLANKLFPVAKIEAKWSVPRKMIKEVEIEELVRADSVRLAPDNAITNRYVHAEWDVSARRFTHFDGAQRIYPRSMYNERLESDLRKFDGKRAGYRKCFKLDGELRLQEWCDLTVRYFAENDLVLEYLGGPRPEGVG